MVISEEEQLSSGSCRINLTIAQSDTQLSITGAGKRVSFTAIQYLIFFTNIVIFAGFPGGASDKVPPASVGDGRDMVSILIPGLERPSGVGHGNPLQYSCLENIRWM